MWLPEPKYVNSYYDASVGERPSFPQFVNSAVCDLCIIGGGITGISAALHAAERGLSVILLEAANVSWAASGRNAGFMSPYVDYDPSSMLKQIGQDSTKEYWSLAHQSVDYISELIERHRIKCDLKHGVLMAATTKPSLARLKARHPSLVTDFGLKNSQLLDERSVREIVHSDRYVGGMLHEDIATIHPLKFVVELAKVAQRSGAQLFERSNVVDFKEHDDSVTVTTQNGETVTCRRLLLATNAYLGDLVPSLSNRFIAMYANMIATDPIDEVLLKKALSRDVSVLELDAATACFYRLSADNRILFGAAGPMQSRNGRQAAPVLERNFHALFPSLVGQHARYVWGGWFGMTALGDSPDIGRLSGRIHYAQAIPVVWATMHGKIFADSLCGESREYELLANMDIPRGPGGQLLSKAIWMLGGLFGSIWSLGW